MLMWLALKYGGTFLARVQRSPCMHTGLPVTAAAEASLCITRQPPCIGMKQKKKLEINSCVQQLKHQTAGWQAEKDCCMHASSPQLWGATCGIAVANLVQDNTALYNDCYVA